MLLQIYRERARVLASAPPSDPAVMHCVTAWRTLHGTRAVWGAGLGPIPWPAIKAWAADQGLDAESGELLEHAIGVADSERSKREQDRRALEQAGVKR